MKFIVLLFIIGVVSARLPPPDKMPATATAAAAAAAAASTPGSINGGDTGMIEKETASAHLPGSTPDESSDDDHDHDHIPHDPFHVLRKVFNIHLRPMSTNFNNFPVIPDTPFVRMQPMFPQNPYSIFGMDPTVTRNRPSLLGSPSSVNSQFPSIFGRPFELPFPRMPHFPSMGHSSLFDPQYEKNLASKGYNTTKSFLPNSDNKMVIIRSVKNTTDTYAEITKVRPFDAELDKDLANEITSGEDKKNTDRRDAEPKPNTEHEVENSSNDAPSASEKPTKEEKSKEASSPAATNVPAESAKQPKPEKKDTEKEAASPVSEVAKSDDKSAENEIPKSGSDAEIKSEDTPIITVNDNNPQ